MLSITPGTRPADTDRAHHEVSAEAIWSLRIEAPTGASEVGVGVGIGVGVGSDRSKLVDADGDVGDGLVPERKENPDNAMAARPKAATAIKPSAT
ncbi:hypothetical protein QCD70_13890 [Agreia sp. PsM10]|nr:hypothetical protein [Agreia sp. PsM10]